MTTIAQLDLGPDPAVVLFLYEYGDDPVPEHMVPPEYEDVSGVHPQPQPGYTYDGKHWRSGEPQKREATRAVVADTTEQAVTDNRAFLEVATPTADEVAAQVASLTRQMVYSQQQELERYGREQDWSEFEPAIDQGLPPTPSQEPVELTAAFTFAPVAPNKNDNVQFDATASTGPVARFDWDFGDKAGRAARAATADMGPTPRHAYAKAGTYTVTLTVANESGDTDDAQQSITIT